MISYHPSQQTKLRLVPKLETIGEDEISTVPWSLCAVDGSLFIPTDKASVMLAVEDAKAESAEAAPQPELVQEPDSSVSVLTVVTMGMLQSMKKTPTMLKLSDLQDAFNKRIEKMVGYDEGRVVFDRYMYQSLKNKTRQKRAALYFCIKNMKSTQS